MIILNKNFFKALVVIFAIIFVSSHHFTTVAYNKYEALGLKNKPVDGGSGNSQKIAKISCMTKSIDAKNDRISITYEFGLPQGRYFYVENNAPSMYVKDPSFDGKLIQPELKLSGPSDDMIVDRLVFNYYDKHNGARSKSDYFLGDGEIIILKSGLIHTLDSGKDDPRKYYPVDFSDINKKLPTCTKETSSSSSGTIVSGQSGSGLSCGTWGPTAQELGTCSDGIKNSNETGIDTGGRCSPAMLGGIGPGSKVAFFGHWPSPTRPVKISIEDGLSPVYSQFLPRALRDWNQAAPIMLTQGGNDSIRVPIKNCDFGPTGWVGVTVVNMNGNRIVSAPVYINDYRMKTSFYNNDIQRQYVVTHELGHALGLDHQDTEFCNPNMGSVMDYTYSILGGTKPCKGSGPNVNFGISNEHPNPNDINGLVEAYINIP